MPQITDTLQDLISAGDAMAREMDYPHIELTLLWRNAKREYLANRPITASEAGKLSKKHPTPAQSEASRKNGRKHVKKGKQ